MKNSQNTNSFNKIRTTSITIGKIVLPLFFFAAFTFNISFEDMMVYVKNINFGNNNKITEMPYDPLDFRSRNAAYLRGDKLQITCEDGGRVRAESTPSGALITTVNQGDVVYALGENSTNTSMTKIQNIEVTDVFVKVETTDGKIGWLFGGCVLRVKNHSQPNAPPAIIPPIVHNEVSISEIIAKSKGDGVRYRQYPSLSEGVVLGHLQKGDGVLISARSETTAIVEWENRLISDYWFKMKYTKENGKIGYAWVHGAAISFSEKKMNKAPKAQAIPSSYDEVNEPSEFLEKGNSKDKSFRQTIISNGNYIVIEHEGLRKMENNLSITVDKEIGSASFQVCANAMGEVLSVRILESDFNEPVFVKMLEAKIGRNYFIKSTDSSKECGMISITVFPKEKVPN